MGLYVVTLLRVVVNSLTGFVTWPSPSPPIFPDKLYGVDVCVRGVGWWCGGVERRRGVRSRLAHERTKELSSSSSMARWYLVSGEGAGLYS